MASLCRHGTAYAEPGTPCLSQIYPTTRSCSMSNGWDEAPCLAERGQRPPLYNILRQHSAISIPARQIVHTLIKGHSVQKRHGLKRIQT